MFADFGEIKMPSRSFVRALASGAGVALVAVAIYAFAGGQHEEPGPQPGNDFDPTVFNHAGHLDVPFVATDTEVVDAMLGMAEVRPGQNVLDLGSGDGRILIAAARSHGAHGLGVDIDPARIRESTANAAAAGVASQVTFHRQDLFTTPLGDADVLALYLLPEVNLRLRPRILAEMRAGTPVVSHDFDMGDWRWDKRQRVGTATVYLWIVPARVGGNWTLISGGRSIPVHLVQHYQQLLGTAGPGRVEQGRVNGTEIRFLANFGEGRRTFEGRIDGDRIVPRAADATWRIERSR